MGLSSIPTATDTPIPFVLVATVLLPIALLVDGVKRAIFQVTGFEVWQEEDGMDYHERLAHNNKAVQHKVHITQYKSLECEDEQGECCVCLHGFEVEEEVSQVLACKHFFHRLCLERWLAHYHTTCPLCRSRVM